MEIVVVAAVLFVCLVFSLIEIKKLLEQRSRLSTQLTELQIRKENEIKTRDEQISRLQELEKNLKDSFSALSSEALKNSNQSFLELAQQNFSKFQEGAKNELEKKEKAIEEILKPFKESLLKVDQKIETLEKIGLSSQASLAQQIKMLSDTSQSLKIETNNLVNALKRPEVRGRWGELQLRRVVEMAGMLNYCDFVEQESINTEEGRLRPDVIIKLPNERNIVVDAKAPLYSYLESIEATTEELRQQKLKEHARHVKDHLNKLGQKKYWEQYQPGPEFVVLFLPGESFYLAAVEQDPTLIEYGVENKVLIATPMNLIALLKVVAYGWRQEAIEENAKEVSKLGAELYDRVRVFAERFVDLKKGLEKAVGSYNDAAGSLERRVLVTARKFKEMDVAGSLEIPAVEQIDKTARALSVELEKIE